MSLDEQHGDALTARLPAEKSLSPAAKRGEHGAPLNEVFRALADDLGHGLLARTSRQLANELDRGVDLPTAMRTIDTGRSRGPLYRALVASAKTGETAAILEGFAQHQAASRRLRRQVRSALLYPIVVTLLLAAVLMLLMFFVAPEFGALYRDFGLDIPAMTSFVIEASQIAPWAILAILCVLPAYFLLWLLPGGRRLAHWLRTGTPVLGRIWMWSAQHEFASIFGALIGRQVMLDDALLCTADALRDRNLARATRIVARKCEAGASLSQAMSESLHFDRGLTGLAAWGEVHNALPEAMRQAVASFEKEIELQVIMLRRILPPLLFIAVATIVFTFVVTLAIPLVNLINNLSSW